METTRKSLPDTEPPVSGNRLSPQSLQVLHTIAAVLAAGAAMLAARFILLLAVIGAFALAWLALEKNSVVGLGVLVAYSICVLLPLVGLELKTSWRGGA